MRLSVNRWHSRNGLGSTGISLTDSVLHKGNAVVIIDLSQLAAGRHAMAGLMPVPRAHSKPLKQ
jgi:hypothetical protein